MRVGFVAACYAAIVRFVRCVHVGMFLPVGGVGESSVTAFVFAFKGFLAWNNMEKLWLVTIVLILDQMGACFFC